MSRDVAILNLEERLTDEELRLLRVIRRECRRAGEARSLFRLGVVLADLEYRQARSALSYLEQERMVAVERRRRGAPLIIRET